MMPNVLGQHGKLGIVAFVAGLHLLQFPEQPVHDMMLFKRLIHKVVVIDFRPNRRIDEFFLQLAMHFEFCQRRLYDPLLGFGIFGLLEFLEETLHFLVVLPKHVRDR